MENVAEATTGMNRLPSSPKADPAESSAALVSVSCSSFIAYLVELARDDAKLSERRREGRAAEVEDGEEGAHDGGGPGDDDAGHDTHLAVRVAFAHGAGTAPDFDHAPDEAEHEHDPERRAESLLQLGGGVAAGGLRQDGMKETE